MVVSINGRLNNIFEGIYENFSIEKYFRGELDMYRKVFSSAISFLNIIVCLHNRMHDYC